MTIQLDTDMWLMCERCDCDLAPKDPKVIAGIMVDDENWLVVYCPNCWEKARMSGRIL